MPCPACKVIIDGGAGVRRSLDCMATTILLNAGEMDAKPEKKLTEALEMEFLAAAEAFVRVAAKIEKHASGA